MADSRRIRAGIVGLGVGEKHIAGYRKHPACRVVALCDFDEKRRAAARRAYPDLRVVADAAEILNDPEIDVVSIASYDNYHHDQIVKALRNDKHVFVEKPLCLHEREAIRIRAMLRKRPHLRLSSNLILRQSPRFRLLKKMIASGKLGRVYYVEGDYNYGRLDKITRGWRGRLDFYSVVCGGGVHLVDLLMWLTGDHVEEVSAYGNNFCSRGSQFRYNDMVVSILKFRSGMVGKIAVNFGCVMPHFHPVTIYGTRATFLNGLDHGTLFESRDKESRGRRIGAAYPGAEKGDLIRGFIDAILVGKDSEVSTDDVFKAMSVCFAIEKAAKSGRAVKVTYI